MIRTMLLAVLLIAACDDSTREDREKAAQSWLRGMNLVADGVSCSEVRQGPPENGWAACAVRFGGSVQILWCVKGGCKMDQNFVLPPAAAPVASAEIKELK